MGEQSLVGRSLFLESKLGRRLVQLGERREQDRFLGDELFKKRWTQAHASR